MPTPLELLIDPVSLAILALYAVLMGWEAIYPGRKLPVVKYWRMKGITAFFFYFYLASYLPLIWDKYLAQYQLFDLTGFAVIVGGIIGVLLYQFGVYWWHRAMHNNDRLWRVFHQMHHSAERLDTYGAFYFSPMDMIGWTVLSSLCFTLIIGLSPQVATVAILINNFLGMFQHTNIKTPVWLGYLIQRPESHHIHHARGIHGYNYSDLPLYDILFGTFKNPKNFEYETGFYHGASGRVLDMLAFRDIDKPEIEQEPVQILNQSRSIKQSSQF